MNRSVLFFYKKIALFLILAPMSQVSFAQSDAYPQWVHYSIDPILPGSSWGTGGPALADFDADGDLDVAISRRNTKSAYWYERKNDSIWIQHLMGSGENLANTLGTIAIDIDHDGWQDVMFNGIWFRNPGNLAEYPETPWPSYLIKAGGHDAVSADINMNGEKDILVYDGNKLAWYNTSNSLRENIITAGHNDHGGTAPRGCGDLDGDGDPEGTGSFHSLGVVDLHMDGYPDIFAGEQEDPDVYMESDGKVAMKPRGLKERGVIWYHDGGKEPRFEPYIIHVDNPGWHDAQLGDVDGDGDMDIVSKVWNADGIVYHLDFWRNQLK